MNRYFLLFLAFTVVASARAEDWPSWRGPRLDGSSLEKDLPTEWTATKNVAWKTTIPGSGHSSPIVSGKRVFLTTCDGEKRVLLCLDRDDGKVLWQREVLTSPHEPKHKLNSYASSTPASDGKHVWVSFLRLRPRGMGEEIAKLREPSPLTPALVPEMVVACYTVEGEKIWEAIPGRFYSRHGFCSPPIPYKDTIILNGDQDADGFLIALDKTTGSTRWKTARPNRTRSYCAPIIVEAAGKTQLILSGSLCVTSYDPDNGKLLWIVDGPTEQFVASPVFDSGLVFLTAGFPDYHNLAIRPDGSGNVTKSHIAWHEKRTQSKKASYVPSPLAHDGRFYMISDLGYLSCFDATKGTRLYMEKLGNHHSASPVLAAGRLYLTDDDGITYVVAAGPTFQLLARNPLGEDCYSSPAISAGHLFIRTSGHLWCIGAK